MKKFAEMNKTYQVIKAHDSAAVSTDQLCLFIDQLFDSVDDNSIKAEPGKLFSSAVILNSSHWEF